MNKVFLAEYLNKINLDDDTNFDEDDPELCLCGHITSIKIR